MAEKPAGMKLLADLAAKRQEITAVEEEREWTQTAPIPKAELKERAKALVQNYGGRMELDAKLGSFAWPQAGGNEFVNLMHVGLPVSTGSAPAGVSLAPLLCGLFGELVQAQLFARIDGLDYVAGPAMADRPAKLADLTETLRRLEIEEEALVVRAEDMGLAVARRENADPAVVLGFDPNGDMPELGLPAKVPLPAFIHQ